MKRILKIAGITLAGVLGTLVVLVALTMGILCYVVFTPARLTPVVQNVCDSLVVAPHGVGKVNLTLYHTFPHLGVEIDSLYVLNPMEGAQSDTLLAAPRVYVGVNVKKYLDEKLLEVTSVELPDVVLNPYINAEGKTNFEISDLIRLSQDDEEESDSSALVLPFDVQLRKLEVNTRQLSFRDRKDSLDIQGLSLSLKAAAAADSALREVAAEVQKLVVDWDGLALEAQGYVNMLSLDTIGMALELKTNTWNIDHVLRILPAQYASLLPKEVSLDGDLELKASVEGQYADSTLMPVVSAVLFLRNGKAAYATIPVPLERIEGKVTAYACLSDLNTAEASIESLIVETGATHLSAKGKVTDIMSDMLLDLQADGRVFIPDFATFLPEAYPLEGVVKKADLSAKIRLSDLTNMRLKRGVIQGNLLAEDLILDTDSLQACIPSASLRFRIPAVGNEQKKTDWISANMKVNKLDAAMIGMGEAHMGETDIDLFVSDILSNSTKIYADLDLKTNTMHGQYEMTDSTGSVSKAYVSMTDPNLCGYVEYDTKDKEGLPMLRANFEMAKLDAELDTISAHVVAPKGSARIQSNRSDRSEPAITAALVLNQLQARMGSALDAKTGYLSVKATAQHDKKKENVLLAWNPRVKFEIHEARALTQVVEDPIIIPEISLTYSNKDFQIDTSRIELGRSDFSLSGKIQNIGPWLENKGLLKGKLRFISSHTDVNQMLAYVSGMGNDEEELNAGSSSTEAVAGKGMEESDPFIVPKGVDLTIDTHILTAEALGETVRNLGGMVSIRDGVLIIEEMGFICDAAKLQLTAMYKTPRRNHIYAGFDYHMTDINIKELVNMIPQVDSMLPMLRSFKGAANFHLAAETYLNAHYQIKPSTCRGACSIDAKDLTLLDGETFTKIAKILTFNKKTENKIDSISAEMTLFRERVDIYPFLISCDKWMGAVGGQHNLDMSFNYHINLLQPLYIGVGVSGTFDDLKIKPEKCIYAKDFRPVFSRPVDTQSADIRRMIKEALEKSLK